MTEIKDKHIILRWPYLADGDREKWLEYCRRTKRQYHNDGQRVMGLVRDHVMGKAHNYDRQKIAIEMSIDNLDMQMGKVSDSGGMEMLGLMRNDYLCPENRTYEDVERFKRVWRWWKAGGDVPKDEKASQEVDDYFKQIKGVTP